MTLEEATRALRDEGAMDPGRKRLLRDRVLATPRKRSTRALRWVLPIAAVLAGASVWASVAREHRVELAPVAPVLPAMTAVAPLIAPVVREEEAPPVLATATANATATATATIARPIVKTVTRAPDDAEKRALRAYREAERLQFEEKDYARALDAWDRFLPIAGASPLVVDARYDRALCLFHLGRNGDARVALEPFARGELGAYRQAEAQSLLGTLR